TMRERAYNRFGKVCSEISGRDDSPLHAAHLNHKRKTGYYNSPENGFLATVEEHLIDHILREGENGLTRSANYSAINSLTKQLVEIEGKEALERVYEYVNKEDAKNEWMEKIKE